MYELNILFWIFVLALAGWYWSDTSKAREKAIAHGKRACKDMNLQFLDGTVVRFRTTARRGSDGQVRLARDFSFEFTPDGIRRHPGHVRLLGNRLQMLDIQYEGSDTEKESNLILSASYTRETDQPSNVVRLHRPDSNDG